MLWGQPLLAGTVVDASRIAYLLVAFATHALVGAVLAASLLGARPTVGAVTGLAPDLDFLFPHEWGFPFVHRGLTHSPAALVAVLLVGYTLDADEDLLAAVGVGYLSHIVLDSLTPKGVLWLYPVSTAGVGADLGGHSAPVTLALWTGCAGVYLRRHGWPGLPDDRRLEILADDEEGSDAQLADDPKL